ncbi:MULTISPECIES: DNA gyrase/topoisomerase IV subunit A [Flectobacillus]|uniref:DNA gyrase/topoisomerase IV subunit A n=1 Tax=Flectobacillus roseus TaxID=502259 RepID=A0ABT6Y3Q7_9BACT|nr:MULTISPECIES: DNA gyrase/topoisomerase IV subunit A [Flectobacillus]MDI9858203.1 DNA gyrase/topoisomerase IV subunit A [Flectobacillus roseus]MDI9867872.1 DNA gyrase/topoisomerase IV subunit A [Flectobacillus roseus]PAC30346.1 DNA topoisomerase IV [Flectobacillus sp. BAB-3569]
MENTNQTEDFDENKNTKSEEALHEQVAVAGLYENWFLEYASYVILERAVPAVEDGLKPVQRRILHALNEMDDGRFNKVANVIGQTMQYHPHGDASINEALVNMGQKDLLFDCQGNWGDIRTGDSAAAARYIEVRLSKFAQDVVFNPQTTEWQLSYDGRKREPITLPVKFPLLLAQGVEGIAVGLATKIMPHNFVELIEASIDILKNKNVEIYPDFLTGGLIDVSNYNDGMRGGKIRVRAKIEELDKKTLIIKEIPFATTTTSLIESIIKANDAGKIKIKKVIDNTAKEVEIQVQLAPGTSPDVTIDALYAFTDCEVSISPNACVIIADKPHFVGVSEILKVCTRQTLELLGQELEIRRGELLEKLLFSSLEKIFIENKIYRDIENCETFEEVVATVDKGLEPYKPQFYREIVEEDLLRLLEIRIKRISKYDSFKADDLMIKLQDELNEVNDNLANLVRYAIDYYKMLLKKYSKGRERKTEIRNFNTITAAVVAAANQKLYVDREGGFIGYSLKKDEYVMDCSDIDDIIVFRKDGSCVVTKIQDKVFVGKDIIYCSVFKKNDDRKVYNLVYFDAKSGTSYIKRFKITAVTRDRVYDLTAGNPKSKVLYFTANDNGEAEVIQINLTASCTARVKQFEYDFKDLLIKGRDSMGNVLTKYPVRKIVQKSAGVSTLGGLDIWYDPTIGRLNRDEHGKYLGNFEAKDHILVVYNDGQYELTNFELTNRYEPKDIAVLTKFVPESVISAVYYDGASKLYYVKRFRIETTTVDKKFLFISDEKGSKLYFASVDIYPRIELTFKKDEKGAQLEHEEIAIDEVAEIRGWKALGSKLSTHKVQGIKPLEPKIVEVSVPESNEEEDKTETEEAVAAKLVEPEEIEFPENSDSGTGEQLGLF